jgi:glycosyltransferase involved in cell wall biosynthesis
MSAARPRAGAGPVGPAATAAADPAGAGREAAAPAEAAGGTAGPAGAGRETAGPAEAGGGTAGPAGVAPAVAAFVGARVYRDGDGYSTDSTSLFEVASLAAGLGALHLHAFVVPGRGRDPLELPGGTRLVDLGRVTDGPSLYRSLPLIAARLLRACRSGSWERAVIVETGAVSLLAVLACAATGRPAIAAIRGDASATAATAQRYRSGPRRPVGLAQGRLHLLTQRTMAASLPVVVDTPEVLARMRGWGGQAVLVPAGSISARDVLAARTFWTPGSGRPLRLLWVGRFERVKGLEDLVRALAILRGSGMDVELELVGGGDPDYRASIASSVGAAGLGGRVRFAGPVPHGPELYARFARADLFVLPSRSEGTPKVVAEAFAHGLPVVATRVGNLPAIVTEGLGLLVRPGDPRALAGAVASYRRAERLRQDGERCLAAASGLTVEATTERLAEALRTARPPRFSRRSPRPGPPRSIRRPSRPAPPRSIRRPRRPGP